MIRRSLFAASLGFLACGIVACANGAKGGGAAVGVATRPAAHAERIKMDGQCLTIDGKDTLVFSGAFHYFRCPKALWHDRFVKLKEAGFNTVETYFAWNVHETEEPSNVNDFSHVDLTDARDWLKMAVDEFGFNVIARPGPYICAEWDGGGYPRWLLNKMPAKQQQTKGIWLRSDDPTYLAWSNHWYDSIVPLIAEYQITHRPWGKAGVILFQIENEYDFDGGPPREAKIKHLRELLTKAKTLGIDVPIFSNVTRELRGTDDAVLKGTFDTTDQYPRNNTAAAEDAVRALGREQHNAPPMVAELQGGWFSEVGNKLSEDQVGIDAKQIQSITLASLQGGATAINYYMAFGGTNFGLTGARGMCTSYDYNAPIKEYGGTWDKFATVQGLGDFIKQFGPSLTRSAELKADIDGVGRDMHVVVRRGSGGELFVFVQNKSATQPAKGELKINYKAQPAKAGDDAFALLVPYDLPAMGHRVLVSLPNTPISKESWYPKAPALPERPAAPDAVRITSATTRPDNEPADVVPVTAGEKLPAVGVFDARYVIYRTSATLDDATLKEIYGLRVSTDTGDDIVARVNGHIVRGTVAGHRIEFALKGIAKTGENSIELLYENAGQPNGGNGMNALPGIKAAEFIAGPSTNSDVTAWRVKMVGPNGEASDRDALKLVGADFDDSKWDAFTLDRDTLAAVAGRRRNRAAGGPATQSAARARFDSLSTAVYRTTLELTDDMLKGGRTRMAFDRIDDVGIIFCNGVEVGRSQDWGDTYSVDLAKNLHAGKNSVAVIVSNHDQEGGLTRQVRLTSEKTAGPVLALSVGRNLRGVADGWMNSDVSSEGWSPVSLDTKAPLERKGNAVGDASDGAGALTTWVRMEFELPKPADQVWTPWRSLITARGDGVIYLNGQCLGRYWERGPQREYYLPECWLNFGAGKKNVLTLCLRPREFGAGVDGAEVSPYPNGSEKR